MNEEDTTTTIDTADAVANDLVALGEAAATRDVSKAMAVFDDNKDGRISMNELRRHKWTITVIIMCLVSGAVGYMLDHPAEASGHWMALVGMAGSFLMGGLLAALHFGYTVTLTLTPTEEDSRPDEEDAETDEVGEVGEEED